ncbi:chromo domain-containing protein, partial [Colletotrichum incanum]
LRIVDWSKACDPFFLRRKLLLLGSRQLRRAGPTGGGLLSLLSGCRSPFVTNCYPGSRRRAMHHRCGVHKRPAPPPKHVRVRSRKSSGLLRQALRNLWSVAKPLREQVEPTRIPDAAVPNETITSNCSPPASSSIKQSSSAFRCKRLSLPKRRKSAPAETELEEDKEPLEICQEIKSVIGHRLAPCDSSRIELRILWIDDATSWEPERVIQTDALEAWLAYTSRIDHRTSLGKEQRDKWHLLAIHSHWIATATTDRRKSNKIMVEVSWEGSMDTTEITENSARRRNSTMVAEYWRDRGGRDVALLDADVREA